MAPAQMITLQFRELEADRVIYPEVSPKVEYDLAEFEQFLASVLLSMRDRGTPLQNIATAT